MKSKNELERKVQQTLESLDGISRAEPKPFFYTRLTARLQRDVPSVWESIGSFISRPAVAIATLCVILALNALILFRTDADSLPVSANEALVSDNEYVLASSSSFDYENIDPQ
ncbi:MAG TPA: hypothetical protein VFZ42_05110 [Chitinophagaceae bacterium]